MFYIGQTYLGCTETYIRWPHCFHFFMDRICMKIHLGTDLPITDFKISPISSVEYTLSPRHAIHLIYFFSGLVQSIFPRYLRITLLAPRQSHSVLGKYPDRYLWQNHTNPQTIVIERKHNHPLQGQVHISWKILHKADVCDWATD